MSFIALLLAGFAGGCSALDGAQSALAFAIILATVLRALTLREKDEREPRQTAIRSSVGSSFARSAGSEVTTRCLRPRAHSTTEASITSVMPLTPQS